MKKNRLFVLGIITMFVAILSLTLVSGTMARYTSKVSGESEAKVAKWAFTINSDNVTDDEKIQFDLFKTINDTKDGADETDVKDTLLAPGTKGSFDLVITNNSDVNAQFDITFDSHLKVGGKEYTAYLPIMFTLKIGSEVKGTSTQLSSFNTLIQDEFIQMSGASTTVTVEWEWVFEGANAADTTLGILAATKNVEYETSVLVVFDQVD